MPPPQRDGRERSAVTRSRIYGNSPLRELRLRDGDMPPHHPETVGAGPLLELGMAPEEGALGLSLDRLVGIGRPVEGIGSIRKVGANGAHGSVEYLVDRYFPRHQILKRSISGSNH